MQRINLGKPYEDYIESLIKAGYYSTATEVIRDALRDKMKTSELAGRARLAELIQQGVDDIKAGRVVKHSPDLMNALFDEAKINSEKGLPIPEHIIP
jgi:putative addiction module CopG family antidote